MSEITREKRTEGKMMKKCKKKRKGVMNGVSGGKKEKEEVEER